MWCSRREIAVVAKMGIERELIFSRVADGRALGGPVLTAWGAISLAAVASAGDG